MQYTPVHGLGERQIRLLRPIASNITVKTVRYILGYIPSILSIDFHSGFGKRTTPMSDAASATNTATDMVNVECVG